VTPTDEPTPATFEDRLLVELTGLVNEQAITPTSDLVARRRGVRRPVLLAGAAAVVAAAAAIVVVPSVVGGKHAAPSGYAVNRADNGTVNFTVTGLINDIASAQSALRGAGAQSTTVISKASYGGKCHKSGNVPMPAGMLHATGPNSIIIDPARIPRGDTVIIQVPDPGQTDQPVLVTLSPDGTPPCKI
jgi:hypothetical protein